MPFERVLIKVTTVPVLLGLVRFGSGLGWVWSRISKKIWLLFGSALFLQNQKTIFQKFCDIFLNFFSNFLKNMKIQCKNTFNQTKIRISQNLIFKKNNNIIFRQFENILCLEIFKCLVLGLGCVEKSQFSLV
jgi:hypothetical protein